MEKELTQIKKYEEQIIASEKKIEKEREAIKKVKKNIEQIRQKMIADQCGELDIQEVLSALSAAREKKASQTQDTDYADPNSDPSFAAGGEA